MNQPSDKDISVYVELNIAGQPPTQKINLDLLRKISRTVNDSTFRPVLFTEEKKPHVIKMVRLIRGMTDLSLVEAVIYAKTISLIYPHNILDAHDNELIYIDFKNEREND